jgi:hypothetical protein
MHLRFDRRVRAFCAAAALSFVACASAGAVPPGAPADQTTKPPASSGGQPVNQVAKSLIPLKDRIDDYMALHRKLEGTLPNLPKEATPEQIDRFQRALAKLIQDERRNAKPGDIFVQESRRTIRGLMQRVFGGRDGATLKGSIMDENPGRLQLTVNSRYPDTVPLSTVPPQVLAGLPRLPEDLEFRFIGRTLILMDVHAHIIVDLIENIIP